MNDLTQQVAQLVDNTNRLLQDYVNWDTTVNTKIQELEGLKTQYTNDLNTKKDEWDTAHPETINKVMTKDEFEALAEQRRRVFAGSGVVDGNIHVLEGGGNHFSYVENIPLSVRRHDSLNNDHRNRFGIGVPESISNLDHWIISVNGYLINLAGLTQNYPIKIPQSLLSPTQLYNQILIFAEVWHENVSDKDVVFPFSSVQFGSNDWNGFSLSSITDLGIEQGYSAFGSWDTETIGKGIKWSDLTQEQKQQWMCEPYNNLYIDGDKVMQVRYRVRVISSDSFVKGQQTWADFTTIYNKYFSVDGTGQDNLLISPQGKLTESIDGNYSDYPNRGYFTTNPTYPPTDPSIDIYSTFGIRSDSTIVTDIPGKCYAIPIAIISRRNMGAYHPKYNPNGSALFYYNGQAVKWYKYISDTSWNISSFTITGVDQTNKQFIIAGDQTKHIQPNYLIKVNGSTDNDGSYFTTNVEYDSTNDRTIITTVNNIPSTTVDGSLKSDFQYVEYCFDPAYVAAIDDNNDIDTLGNHCSNLDDPFNTVASGWYVTGTIASNMSGREDDLYSDEVNERDVTDLRKSARRLSYQDILEEIKTKLRENNFRGKEQLALCTSESFGVVIDEWTTTPFVLKDLDGTYKMWYSAKRIHYATSEDGINWTKYGVVLDIGANGDTDDYHVYRPSVLKDSDGTYKMWYGGSDGSHYRIHYATSEDGINWTKHGVVLDLGANGDIDDRDISHPFVLKDSDGTYKMWYGGFDGTHRRIHYATSENGVNWTKHGVVIDLGADGDTDDWHVYSPSVFKDSNGTYKMWYTGSNGSHDRIHYAILYNVDFCDFYNREYIDSYEFTRIANKTYRTFPMVSNGTICLAEFNKFVPEFDGVGIYPALKKYGRSVVLSRYAKQIHSVIAKDANGNLVEVDNYTYNVDRNEVVIAESYSNLGWTSQEAMDENIAFIVFYDADTRIDGDIFDAKPNLLPDSIDVVANEEYRALVQSAVHQPVISYEYTASGKIPVNFIQKRSDNNRLTITHPEINTIQPNRYSNIIAKLYLYPVVKDNVVYITNLIKELKWYCKDFHDPVEHLPFFGDVASDPKGYKYGVVLDIGANGDTDDYHVSQPSVLKDSDGTYKMWYIGHNGSYWRTHYATSPDGINWTKHGVVVDLGVDGDTDDNSVYSSFVLKDSDGTYKMWYSGSDGSHYRIHYAASEDGVNWTKHGVVLDLGANGDTDDCHVADPFVFKDSDGTYKMWYAGNGSHYRIHYAASTNGINWTKYGVVLDIGANGDTDDYNVSQPFVLKDSDGTYKMWYGGSDGSHDRIHYLSTEILQIEDKSQWVDNEQFEDIAVKYSLLKNEANEYVNQAKLVLPTPYFV